MPGDLELALRVRADMREALQGIGALNRSLGDTARRGGEAGAALTGAGGAAQAFTTVLGALGRESGSTFGRFTSAAESAFSGMEAALTRFVTTGKLDFSGFADSVIADLTRIATRRYIVGPLADLLFGALGGGGDDGNRAGQTSSTQAARSARWAASRAATGLRADEVPIIAQRGERILQRGATIAPPAVEINFENRGTPQREVSREVRLDPRGLIVTVVTDDIRRGGADPPDHRPRTRRRAPLRAVKGPGRRPGTARPRRARSA